MKRKLSIAFAGLFMSLMLSAQEPAIALGDKILNLGIGFGSTLYTGSYWSSTIPPLSASFEKIIKDEILEIGYIGVGAYAGLAAYKYNYSFFGEEWGWKYTNIVLGGRGAFHYPLIDKLDTYTGVMLGFQIVTFKEIGTATGTNPASSGVVWSWYAGGRYFFNEKFSAMAEFGYGITYLNLGVGIRL